MPLQKMIGAAFFAAIISVLYQFFIPIGTVPHTLQVFAVTLAGVVLGPVYGAVSVIVWILLGIFGVPVFTMGQAGVGVLFTPLGGFIVGFIFQGWICGYCSLRQQSWLKAASIGVFSVLVVYSIGVLGFMAACRWILQKPVTLWQSVLVCVIPFIPFDLIKMGLGIAAGRRISAALQKAGIDLR